MVIIDWLKNYWFKLKIFGWYLVTEPFRQFLEILRLLHTIINKTITWTYVALCAIIISLMMGNKYYAGLFVLSLLFVILLWEWERGFYMHRHRQKTMKKIEQKASEVMKNERDS